MIEINDEAGAVKKKVAALNEAINELISELNTIAQLSQTAEMGVCKICEAAMSVVGLPDMLMVKRCQECPEHKTQS